MVAKKIAMWVCVLALMTAGTVWAVQSQMKAGDCCGCECCGTGTCYPGCCPCNCAGEDCCSEGKACTSAKKSCCSK